MRLDTGFLFLLCIAIIGCGLSGAKPALAADGDKLFGFLSKANVEVSISGLNADAINQETPYSKVILKFIPVSKEVGEAVKRYQVSHPVAKLAACSSLHSLHVELDNQANTQEWLVARGKNCAPLPKDERVFWVVQQQKNALPKVLFVDKGTMVEVLPANAANPNNHIIRATRRGKPCPTCSGVICTRAWFNKTGSYRGGTYTVEEFRKDYGYEEVDLKATKCPLD